MSTTANFLQILDAVKDKFSLTDKEVAQKLECEPTYLSKIRNGKAQVGPRMMRAINRLQSGEQVDNGNNREADGRAQLVALAQLAGVSEARFLAELLQHHGLDVATRLKAAAAIPVSRPASEEVEKSVGVNLLEDGIQRVKTDRQHGT